MEAAQQLRMLADLVAALRLSDLPWAVLFYPFNTVNFYHFSSEVLPMLHRSLCQDLGACRYWGLGTDTPGADGAGDTTDPAYGVATDPTDFTIIMWTEFKRRWIAAHEVLGSE